MPFLLAAILANLSYAFADNINGLAAKRNPPLRVVFWTALSAIVLFFIPLIIFFRQDIARLDASSLAWIIGISMLSTLGFLAFITAMSKGSVTLTGVIGGSFPAVTVITSLLVFGESITMAQGAAVIVILLGIVLSSLPDGLTSVGTHLRSSAVLYALATFVLWGVYFALIRIPTEQVGWFVPQYGSSVVALMIFSLIAVVTKDFSMAKRPALLGLIATTAVLQVGGSMFFAYAVSQGPTSIVAPIAGSSPAVFVIIAFFIFKERLGGYQKIGIVTALAGIIALSILST